MSDFHDKTVLVTGGSAGFGLHLASAFGAAGANLVLVARDPKRLQMAASSLKAKRIKTSTYTADITSATDVEDLANFVRDEVGQLDVLVNAAGKSDRGRVTETSIEMFQELWELNFLGAVRCTAALLPSIQAAQGSIVQIGSLACKTSGRFLGAYPASKFPLAAYSQQLRLETADDGVHVLLVCPGPIQGDHDVERYADRTNQLPDSARRPGGTRLPGLDPVVLARRVVLACQRREIELVVPGKARWLFAISQIWPRWGDRIVRKMTS